MVLLSTQGWSPPAIATHMGYCPASVRRILRQFLAQGVQGLRRRRPGPPPDTARRQQVETALRELLSQPRTFSSTQLSWALREKGIELSPRQIRKYLKGMGARYLRTARTLRHRQDPQRVERARRTLEALKKRPPPGS